MIPLSWRLGALGALLAAFIGLAVYAGHLKREAAHARSEAVAAQTQTKVEQAAMPIVERYHDTQVRIITQAERSAADVQRLPTAETPLDDGFAGGLIGVLNAPTAGPAPNGPGKP